MMKLVSSALVCAMTLTAVPVHAGDGGRTPGATPAKERFRSSIEQIAVRSTLAAPAAALSAAPAPRPLTPADRSRKQMTGGSKTGMVLGVVGSLVGVAATVYMVKEMRKATDRAAAQ